MGRSIILKFFITIIFIFTFLLSSVNAEDSIELEHNGIAGFWFPEDTATKMLKDLRELPLLRKKGELYELEVKKQEELKLLLMQDIEVTEKISSKWEKAFEKQVKVTKIQKDYYKDQLSESKKWYRSPVLWFSTGFLLAGGLAIGLNYGLADAR